MIILSLWIVWLVVVILLVVIEAMTVNLVTIWFIISGIITMFLSFFLNDLISQFAVFVLLGILLMLLTKPFLEELKKNKEEKLNLERIIGMQGVVIKEIKKNVVGEVKVDGKTWSAIADKRITVDSDVVVLEIRGVKLVVSKVKKNKK